MLILNSLELAIEYHKSFAHIQGYQDPKKVIDTANMFMAYLKSNEGNSVKESSVKELNRNPSKSGNS